MNASTCLDINALRGPFAGPALECSGPARISPSDPARETRYVDSITRKLHQSVSSFAASNADWIYSTSIPVLTCTLIFYYLLRIGHRALISIALPCFVNSVLIFSHAPSRYEYNLCASSTHARATISADETFPSHIIR